MRLADAPTDTLLRPLPKPLLVVSCLALCGACLEDPSDPGTTGSTAAADLFSAWPGDESFRIAAEPSLVVGSDESLPLGRVSGAVFFGDGIAIADRMSYEVLILDAAGRLLSRHGRRGEGPGDYMNLAAITRHADGLVTSDASFLMRATRLDASGRYIGDTKLGPVGYQMSRIVGAFGNSVLLEMWEMGWRGRSPAGPMEIRQPVTYRIVRLSDGEIVFEGTRPGQEQWALREVYDDAGNMADCGQSVVFGRTAVSAVTDRYAYLADTDSSTITRYDEAGTAVEVSFEQPRESAEADWVRFVIDTLRANEFISECGLRLLEDLPARPTLPAFSAMMGGADGLLWIREYPNPLQDQVVWVGFSEALERKKRITMPVRLHVLDISEDRVLVQAKGAHDETLIEVYAVER
ncbi:MAG: 6-bladed beta-propeller [Gemmatimonadota bacterium]|nr:6-bladed beta-propeller [Gemmatimonadota bacterium]